MAVKDKKARFNPFVPPTHFQQQVGWGTRLGATPLIQIKNGSTVLFHSVLQLMIAKAVIHLVSHIKEL